MPKYIRVLDTDSGVPRVADTLAQWMDVDQVIDEHISTEGGIGDVVGPASAVADHLAVFNGTTGKWIKDGGTVASVPVKATGAEVNAGSDDAKFLTPKAIEDSDYAKTAAITAAAVGLSNVNNTSDANKPVSTATQTVLDLKIPISYLDTDAALTANSDVKVATQKAVKAYVDTNSGGITNDAPANTVPVTTDGSGNLGASQITDDGTDVRTITTQEPAPDAPVATLGAAGTNPLTAGDYKWKIVFITSGTDHTEAGTVSNTLTVDPATEDPPHVVLPTGSGFVTSREVYRTAANGSVFKKVATISNNLPNYDIADDVADVDLGVDAPSTNTTANTILDVTEDGVAIQADSGTQDPSLSDFGALRVNIQHLDTTNEERDAITAVSEVIASVGNDNATTASITGNATFMDNVNVTNTGSYARGATLAAFIGNESTADLTKGSGLWSQQAALTGLYVWGASNGTGTISKAVGVHIAPLNGNNDDNYGLIINDVQANNNAYAIRTGLGRVAFGDKMSLYNDSTPADGELLVGKTSTGTFDKTTAGATNMALPTSDPEIAGALWSNLGAVQVSNG